MYPYLATDCTLTCLYGRGISRVEITIMIRTLRTLSGAFWSSERDILVCLLVLWRHNHHRFQGQLLQGLEVTGLVANPRRWKISRVFALSKLLCKLVLKQCVFIVGCFLLMSW